MSINCRDKLTGKSANDKDDHLLACAVKYKAVTEYWEDLLGNILVLTTRKR
jgi:hypothetical protein